MVSEEGSQREVIPSSVWLSSTNSFLPAALMSCHVPPSSDHPNIRSVFRVQTILRSSGTATPFDPLISSTVHYLSNSAALIHYLSPIEHLRRHSVSYTTGRASSGGSRQIDHRVCFLSQRVGGSGPTTRRARIEYLPTSLPCGDCPASQTCRCKRGSYREGCHSESSTNGFWDQLQRC